MESDLKLVYTAESYTDYLWCSSLLESADIKFYAKNAELQNLFGAGVIGTGYNVLIGPIKIYVSKIDAEIAIEIITNADNSHLTE